MTNERVTANGLEPDATGFQVPTRHLIVGGTLFGVGCAICIVAKGTWAQAKAAYSAGSRAWQDENTAQLTNAQT